MDKCVELLKETDPATIIKPIKDQIKQLFTNGRVFHPLEVIGRDTFIESEMLTYIHDYVNEFKAQFDQLFNGRYKTSLESISNDAKQAIRSSSEGFAADNYKTLRILVDGGNSVGSSKAKLEMLHTRI